MTSRADCEKLDAGDPLRDLADRFAAGEPGTLYFDANSIGAMPVDVPARIEAHLAEWRNLRRRGWSESTWLDAPRRLGSKLAPILGAAPDEVVVGDTTYDIEMGHAAGARTCAVTYGSHDALRLASAKPTFALDSLAGLAEHLSR